MSKLILVLKESAQVLYGEEEQRPFPEKELVKAQFVVELNERLGYPLSAIHLNVPVFLEGHGFEDIDIVAQDKRGEGVIVAAVESPQAYEAQQERAMRGLYKKAAALMRRKQVRSLAYYTGWYAKGMRTKRQIVVDYAAYPTYLAWQAAGFPSVGVLPAYKRTGD